MRSCFPSLNPRGKNRSSASPSQIATCPDLKAFTPAIQKPRVMKSDYSHQTDCRVMSRVKADAAFPPHTAQPGRWSSGHTGQRARCLPSALRRPPTCSVPVGESLDISGRLTVCTFLVCKYSAAVNRGPTPSPGLCIPGLISSSQQPRVAGIPTRVGLSPDARLFSPECFL